MEKLKTFDAYAKTLDDFKVRTNTGALISIVSIVLATVLVISEFYQYMQISVKPELFVDKNRQEKLSIRVNMTFARMPCNLLSLDVMDSSGEQQINVHHDVEKTRIDENGKYIYSIKESYTPASPGSEGVPECGPCYNAPEKPDGECCNTCDDVINAYAASRWAIKSLSDFKQCVKEGRASVGKLDFESKEGCNIYGSFQVNKVAGNFHAAPGRSYQHGQVHVHDIHEFIGHMDDIHFDHTIHQLVFGDSFSGQVNPLDGFSRRTDPNSPNHAKDPVFFQYFIKVVPTEVRYLNGTTLMTNQYSVTRHETPFDTHRHVMPGIFFIYDISPMRVVYNESRKPLSTFLTDVCAILGGIFTVARFIDAVFFKAERALQRKIDLGKIN